ncbi:MAG: RNA polymerase sigma factor [archaeon]
MKQDKAPEPISAEASEAVRSWYMRKGGPIIQYLSGRFPGVDPEAVLQDTAIRVAQKYHTLQDTALMDTWAYRIAINRAREVARNDNRRRHVSLESVCDADTPELVSWSRADRELDIRMLTVAVDAVLWDVPDQREVVDLMIQGYSYRDISDQLGIPVTTVKARIWHCRNRLARDLDGAAREAAAQYFPQFMNNYG